MPTNLLDVDWSKLPMPEDDGGARHLPGLVVPDIPLDATSGGQVSPGALAGCTVLYVYPMTGRPGVTLPNGWDQIPGARGCTPQACAFRDHYADLKEAGADHVFGLSAQTHEDQVEAVERLHLPFPLLADSCLVFAKSLRLPLFRTGDRDLTKRLTMIIDDARITHVFYPVFPPDRNAADVLNYLKGRSS
jgi:peroxiredoxin